MPGVKRHPQSPWKARAQGNPHGGLGGKIRKTPKRKSISFSTGENCVRLVKAPPKAERSRYWFTTTQRVVKKGVLFEVDPEIYTAVEVDCRMQLCTIAKSADAVAPFTPSSKTKSGDTDGGSLRSSRQGGTPSPASCRSHFSVRCEDGIFVLGKSINLSPRLGGKQKSIFSESCEESPWMNVGSVLPGQLQRIRVVLPPGRYHLRCEGNSHPIQVFAQVWDLEQQLT